MTFLIPGLLPYGYLVLLHGDPGCWQVRYSAGVDEARCGWAAVPAEESVGAGCSRGPAIYFNADMSSLDFREEYDLHEIKNGREFRFEPDFNLYRQAQFVKTMNKYKPSIICIDSLSSCSGGEGSG